MAQKQASDKIISKKSIQVSKIFCTFANELTKVRLAAINWERE